jgi:hypothetical protein
VKRRPAVPPTREELARSNELAPSFREQVEAFRSEPPREKLKIVLAGILFLPFLGLVFLVGFFLFGGWRLFEDHLPAWLGRLFTAVFIVLLAWSVVSPLIDRLGRGRSGKLPPRS